MAIINYNLKQITNYDAEAILASGTMETTKIGDYNYYILTTAHFGGLPMLKFGYICEPKAFQRPIYISFQGSTVPNKITLGQTGIFEIQPEEFIDKNNPEAVEKNIEFKITEVKVPMGVAFSIDYITAAEANVSQGGVIAPNEGTMAPVE